MKKKPVSINIVLVPLRPILPAIQQDFNLGNHRLKTLRDIWKKQETDFNIRIFIDGTLVTDSVIGASNIEKLNNLKIFLANEWKKEPILLKDPRLFWLDLL